MRMWRFNASLSWVATVAVASLFFLAACDSGGDAGPDPGPDPDPDPDPTDTTPLPLTDMTDGRTYQGFTGGLYPNHSNTMPTAHATEGARRTRLLQPLDRNGTPSTSGKFVMISVGMSNTSQEFCSRGTSEPCFSWSFSGQAAADPAVNQTTLTILNGAKSGQSADFWDGTTMENYDRIRTEVLTPRGFSEAHVQVAWVKVAHRLPTASLPASNADAYQLMARIGDILRTMKQRYPNLQMVFLSSRTYAGYAVPDASNPEPYAYESGYAVKWLIEAQINQMATGQVDPIAGDLNYNTVVPWVAWSAYFWADGQTARSDGMTWVRADFETDGMHPGPSGEGKVGAMMLDFFKTSAQTRCWFLAGQTCN